jgi:hypothetical protein
MPAYFDYRINVDRRGIDRLARRFPEVAADATEEMLDDAGGVISRELRDLTRERVGRDGRGYSGAYMEGHRINLKRGGYRTIKVQAFNVAEHARFVEIGRRPGAMPPIAPIQAWAWRVLGDKSLRTAFRIARRIGLRGTEGHHIYADALRTTRPRIELIARTLGPRILRRLQ